MQNAEVFSKAPGVWCENVEKSPKMPSFVEDAKLFGGGVLVTGVG